MRRALVVLALACLSSSCGSRPPEVVDPPPPSRAPLEITLLYTNDEHGWLLPFEEDGKQWGGAAELYDVWKEREHHCEPSCERGSTIAVSGGDNFSGPAITTYFGGAPMADALARLGYSVSAFGNHEFDFGQAQFVRLAQTSKITYVAANLVPHDPAAKSVPVIAPFTIVERGGARVAFVGLVTDKVLQDAMASRFAGFDVEAEEGALTQAVAHAWVAQPDAVVVVAHDCPDRLAPIVARHPELNVAVVLAGHCHKVMEVHAGTVELFSTGWRLQHYLRVRMRIDPNKPPGKHVLEVEPTMIDVDGAIGEKRPADPTLVTERDAWEKKLDAALGETIGFSSAPLEKTSPELARWIAGAFRDEEHTDVGLVNSHGIRQSLPKGTITKATVWSILPFDNKIVVARLRGRDLVADAALDEARFAGLEQRAGQWFVSGAPVDPDKLYSVATIDFLYLGGSNFPLKAQDPNARETGVDWREPVIAWTKRQNTSAGDPLERHIPR